MDPVMLPPGFLEEIRTEVLLVVMVLAVLEVHPGVPEVLLGLPCVHQVVLEDMEVHQEVLQADLLVPQVHPIVGLLLLVWEGGVVCRPGEVLLGAQVHQVRVPYLHLEAGDHLKEDRTIQEVEAGDHLQPRSQLTWPEF